MIRTSFNDGWQVRPKVNPFAELAGAAVGDVVRIAPEGVRVTTPDIDEERAVVEVATRVDNDSIAIRTVDVVTNVREITADGAGAAVTTDVATVSVCRGSRRPSASGSTCAARRCGLRIDGETVKLRGACIHHDNGVIGARTFARAVERRIQLLKAAGVQRRPHVAPPGEQGPAGRLR